MCAWEILENTFLSMKKVRAWPILTLAMPYVKTEQIQNLALFWDCCKRPKSVICQKTAMFEQLNDQLVVNSK